MVRGWVRLFYCCSLSSAAVAQGGSGTHLEGDTWKGNKWNLRTSMPPEAARALQPLGPSWAAYLSSSSKQLALMGGYSHAMPRLHA